MDQATPGKATRAGDPADVVAALLRVLDSPQFSRSPRARGFLAYVVTETLAGRGARLSERTIARRALHRDADFDGRADASVRVQAVRVRKHLDDYYAADGADEPLRIALPRGTYVPTFELSERHGRAGATVPGVVVVMLTATDETPAGLVARSLSESLVQHLAAHGHLRVVGPVDSSEDHRTSAAAGGVTTVLTGHVGVRDGMLRLSVRLHDAAFSEVLWSDDEVIELEALADHSVEQHWSRAIAAKLGDPSGPVIRQELARRTTSAEPELAGRLAFYAYLQDGSVASVHAAVAALDAALEAGERTPTLLAMRAAMANTASNYEFADRDTELDRAETLAREALARDAGNAHAHLVLSYPLLQRGHAEVAVRLAERAAELAPYQPFYLSTAGIALVVCGEWGRGSALIRESLRINPGQSGQTYSWLAMAHLVEGDYERALVEAAMLPADGDYLWGPLFRAMALSGVGYLEQAQVEAARAREMRPDVMADVGAHLSSVFRLTPDQLARLVGLLDDTTSAVPEPRAEMHRDSVAGSSA